MFISEAIAQTVEVAQTVENTGAPEWIKVVIQFAFIFAIFYLLLIRPAKKREKNHMDQINAIIKGFKVNVGGIIGTVTQVKGDELTVEISKGVEITVLKHYINNIITDNKEGK